MPDDVALAAGSLSATIEGADLIDIRRGAFDVATRIQVTVRDRDWRTVPPSPLDRRVSTGDGRFVVDLAAEHVDHEIDFSWRARVEGNAEGELTFAFEGVADRDSAYRRIGICILHPWRTYVGARFRASDPDGASEGTFPTDIAPQPLRDGRYQPMIGAFSELDVGVPGEGRVRFSFEGDRFELEDQRNWTDPSFKTYSTPLSLSEPRTLRRGERIEQRVVVRIETEHDQASVPDDGRVKIEVGPGTGARVPPIGIVAPVDPTLRPSHVRVEVGPDAPMWPGLDADVPLEVGVRLEPDGRGADGLAGLIAGRRIARLLVHRADGATISAAELRAARSDLRRSLPDGVPIVGGTWSFFSELNRRPPDGSAADAISFAISPQVHATDDRSVMATLEIQEQVVRQAAAISGGSPIVVSPVTLAGRDRSRFADAWTIGSIARLAPAGAAAITFGHAPGALALATALVGRELRSVSVSDPGKIAAFAAGGTLVLANLTLSDRTIEPTPGGLLELGPYEVRGVEVGEAASS